MVEKEKQRRKIAGIPLEGVRVQKCPAKEEQRRQIALAAKKARVDFLARAKAEGMSYSQVLKHTTDGHRDSVLLYG